MDNKITIRLKLNNPQKIGFTIENLGQDFMGGLAMPGDNIEILEGYFDDLCKNTINNGHNLLKSNGIFNIDSSVVNPMSTVIGQYLFRLLFGATQFQDILHRARKEKKELDIILEFDLSNEQSKDLASLPWELMYCPDSKGSAEKGDVADEDMLTGFFVSQVASISRRYQESTDPEIVVDRKVEVAVAFLIRDIENLTEVYRKLRELATNIEQKNSNIHFTFINEVNEEKNSVSFLAIEDLKKIFLYELNIDPSKEIKNKIIHIICDVSTIEYKGKNEKSLFFNKIETDTRESISYSEIFLELFNKTLLSDDLLKLVVLQAWKDENRSVYSGFEDIANRIIKKNKTAIISMPYVLKKGKAEDGKDAFFNTLYDSLAGSMSITQVVQKLRNDIVQRYAYGFPLLYLNSPDQVLVSAGTGKGAQKVDSNDDKNVEKEKEYRERYRYIDKAGLEASEKELKDKLKYFISKTKSADDTVEYTRMREIELINLELSVIRDLVKNLQLANT